MVRKRGVSAATVSSENMYILFVVLIFFGIFLIYWSPQDISGNIVQEHADQRRPIQSLSDLGKIPSDAMPTWPAEPTISKTHYISTQEQYDDLKGNPNTQFIVTGHLGDIRIEADDVVVVIQEGASVQQLFVTKSRQRLRITGPGTAHNVKFDIPEQFGADYQAYEDWCIQDVLIDGLVIPHAGDKYAFDLPCVRRTAIINSEGTSNRYAVWSGNNPGFTNTDVILARNKFYGGEGCPTIGSCEATVRLVDHTRSAVIGNVIHNPHKHVLRYHGVSSYNTVKNNLFLSKGFMTNGMPNDDVQHLYFGGNVFYHQGGNSFSLFQIDNPERIKYVEAKYNIAYTGWPTFYNHDPQQGWAIYHNQVYPEQELPSPYWVSIH